MHQTILTRLNVNSQGNSSKFYDDVQVNKSFCKDRVKPKIFNKSSNPSSGEMFQKTNLGLLRVPQLNVDFVALLITLLLIVMFIHL